MRKIITLIVAFFCLTITCAQDVQLLDNDWYLEKLLIEGEEVFQPASSCSEQGRMYYFQNNISVDNLCCESTCFSDISYQDTTGFQLTGEIGCLLIGNDCALVEWEYSELHTSVYFDPSNPTFYNPYSYEIIDNGNDLALVITNGIGDKAYYNNVLLNIQNFPDTEIILYPNPVKDKLVIQSQVPIGRLQVYTMSGKEVLDETLNTASLDVLKLSLGVYFVKISTTDGVAIKKIVKK